MKYSVIELSSITTIKDEDVQIAIIKFPEAWLPFGVFHYLPIDSKSGELGWGIHKATLKEAVEIYYEMCGQLGVSGDAGYLEDRDILELEKRSIKEWLE